MNETSTTSVMVDLNQILTCLPISRDNWSLKDAKSQSSDDIRWIWQRQSCVALCMLTRKETSVPLASVIGLD